MNTRFSESGILAVTALVGVIAYYTLNPFLAGEVTAAILVGIVGAGFAASLFHLIRRIIADKAASNLGLDTYQGGSAAAVITEGVVR